MPISPDHSTLDAYSRIVCCDNKSTTAFTEDKGVSFEPVVMLPVAMCIGIREQSMCVVMYLTGLCFVLSYIKTQFNIVFISCLVMSY